MKLIAGDLCPQTGEYTVLNADGKLQGRVFLFEGETMPPSEREDDYFEFFKN